MPELVAGGPAIPVRLLNELDSGKVVFFCGASSAIFAFSSPENLRRFPLICILRQTVEYTLATEVTRTETPQLVEPGSCTVALRETRTARTSCSQRQTSVAHT